MLRNTFWLIICWCWRLCSGFLNRLRWCWIGGASRWATKRRTSRSHSSGGSNAIPQGHHQAPSIYIMIELCYFCLDQWEIKIHLLCRKSFNIPDWPRRRLQHIEELSKSKTRVGTVWLTLFHLGGADLPPPRASAHTRKKSMGENSDNFCIFLCMLGKLETIFHGQTIFRSVGGSHENMALWGDPYEWCQSCLWAPKCKEKTFSSKSSGTKWLRHQKCVLNWRFLRELNSNPILEQVTPSSSSGNKEKAWGEICPPPPPPGVKRSKKCRVS